MKTKLVKEIYEKLAKLEDLNEEYRIAGKDVTYIVIEMNDLKLKLSNILNSNCPIVTKKVEEL